MKKSLFAYFFALLLLFGCAKTPYIPPVTRPIAPEISLIATQAKNTTNSAERTVEYAKVVESKFKGDKDATATVKSAQETVIESQKTEAQLKSVQQKAVKLDGQVAELENKYSEVAEDLGQEKIKNQKLTDKIKELTSTIWNQRWIIGGLSVLLVAAVAFVVKPWKWFI